MCALPVLHLERGQMPWGVLVKPLTRRRLGFLWIIYPHPRLSRMVDREGITSEVHFFCCSQRRMGLRPVDTIQEFVGCFYTVFTSPPSLLSHISRQPHPHRSSGGKGRVALISCLTPSGIVATCLAPLFLLLSAPCSSESRKGQSTLCGALLLQCRRIMFTRLVIKDF